MVVPLSILSHVVAQDFNLLQQLPMSTLLILLISLAISLVTTIANRAMMNVDEYKRITIESQYARQEVMAAMRSKNQRAIAKAQKLQQETMKDQQKMMMGRMKTTLLFFVPFILIWQVLINFFKGVTAYMPLDFPWIGSELSVGTWYIFCSISTNIVVSRVLGLTFEIEPRAA